MPEDEIWWDATAMMQSGVYLLLWKGTVVYVGQSVQLSKRVGTHISLLRAQLRPKQKRVVFDQVLVKHVKIVDLNDVEAELIRRYQPQYNIRQPKPRAILTPEIKQLLLEILPPPRDTFERRYIERRL